MEIAGLPLHALVVHAAVVFSPLAALVALAHAAVPRWRWANPALESSPAVATHSGRGELMLWVGIGIGVVSGAAALLLGGPTSLVSGRGAKQVRSVAVDRVLAAVTVLAAVVMIVWVVLTGDAGARAVWG